MIQSPMTLAALNAMTEAEFVAVCGGFFEHSPWVAKRAFARRPFASREALGRAMVEVVHAAATHEQLALIRAHPDLVGKLAREGKLTRESTMEQAAAGLSSLTPEEVEAFDRFNRAYQAKFGFPFIICARENKKAAIMGAFPGRLQNSHDEEVTTALAEIAKIANLRLRDTLVE